LALLLFATCSAHLHVQQRTQGAPCFARVPNSVQCAPGFTAVFEYTVAGEPCPDVEWFKGNKQLFLDAHCFVAHHPDGSGSLTVQECTEEDAGLYICRAVNSLGEAACSAELLVLPEEHVLTKKDTVLGSSIQMECKVSGSLPISAKWFKDGKEITDSAKYRSLCHENTMSLEIANLELTDTANYTCNVSNIAGSDSCSAVLTVKGTPPFDVTWYKDKRQIRSSKKYKVTAKNYHTSIRILNVEVADVGEYQCKAQNDVGSDTCFCTVKLKGKILAFCGAPNGTALLFFYVDTVFTTTACFLYRTTEIRDKNKQHDCCDASFAYAPEFKTGKTENPCVTSKY
uniref:Ig-like domain-containing protein n=1 Tax=Pavo cristatus TaxID=9049 RepID=A0A8C9L6K7_PAVCR